MAGTEDDVTRHYTHGALEQAIRDGLAKLGEEAGPAAADDLAFVDEFHLGGRQATVELAAALDLRPGIEVLDVGCGIGGAARVLAGRFGCRVVGIDLTPEYVQVAQALTAALGLAGQVEHRVASATALPFPDASFDVATMLHVGMNIEDKTALGRGVHRVLRPGGTFAVYDVMRVGAGELQYPVPWASRPEISFLAEPEVYRRALADAGFTIVSERDRRELAIDFLYRMRARVTESGPPPLGLHLLMGADARAKVGNILAALEAGVVAPIELIARR